MIIPIFVVFNGKRYCSWICGCGGLAETFGDRWRHLAPKGRTSIRWEWMNTAVLIFATVVTVWCRYWCALAKMMGLLSGWYAKLGLSRFHIVANDKCIACNECLRNCQVGIDVMQYALKRETLDNATSPHRLRHLRDGLSHGHPIVQQGRLDQPAGVGVGFVSSI